MDSHYEPLSKDNMPFSSASDKTDGNLNAPPQHAFGAKSWLWHVISHVLSLLWLAPAIILLYLNFTDKIIGNTLWCPSRNCNVVGSGQRSAARAMNYDRMDHDVNGVLLFVQKAIELWFTAVATLLVYDIAMMFARREGGLPIGYLLMHLEFTDLLNLLNPLVWKSAFSKRQNASSPSDNANKSRVVTFSLFAILVTFLTIIANLMGPAGGILVLPTIQWVDTNHMVQEQFHSLLSAEPPSGNRTLANCSATDLANEGYSCTNYVYAPMLENIISSITAATRENAFQTKPSPADTLVSEAKIQFAFDNTTSDERSLIFVPNRQALSSLSAHVISNDDELFANGYKDSIQAIAHRSGPAIGSFVGFAGGNITTANVTNDKHVRCITGWTDGSSRSDDGNFTQYTKCIRIGKGWSVSNNVAGFEIRNRTAQRGDPLADNDVVVNIYFSDRATYFNETTDFGSGLGSCSANSSYADCHWDDIFSSSLPPDLNRISKNSLVVETYLRSTEGKTGIWVDSTNYPVWADYQLGLSPFIDPVVATANTTTPNASTTTPLVIHPNWILAAWSVDTSRVINGTSTVGSMFANIVNRDIHSDSSSETGSIEIVMVPLLTTAQALSLIPYNSTDLRHSHATMNKNDVYFYYWRSRRVWMYSIGSRTAKLGVVIVMIGMVVVVLRTFLAVYEKLFHNYVTRVLSPTELVVATLSHQPEGEFDHCVDETASAQVRFRIGDEGGVLKFRPQKTKSQ